jgi:UDP-N-acetylmuramoyl-tripeptide--D-alanyl-D-alanine ligase
MKPAFTVGEIAAAVGGTVTGVADARVLGVSTDSRSVEPGELFIPLRGENFDGHQFIAGALQRGVRVILAEQGRFDLGTLSKDASCITVSDTLLALGDLAAFHRNRFSLPVVAITGSNGKTTTKEMLATILAGSGEGLKTAGNLNNLIGLPRMVFQLCERHNWAVLEMGMSEPGEIDRLAEIARPDIGVNSFSGYLREARLFSMLTTPWLPDCRLLPGFTGSLSGSLMPMCGRKRLNHWAGQVSHFHLFFPRE